MRLYGETQKGANTIIKRGEHDYKKGEHDYKKGEHDYKKGEHDYYKGEHKVRPYGLCVIECFVLGVGGWGLCIE